MASFDPIYCALCEFEASEEIPATHTPLCDNHATAYKWGQNFIPQEAIPADRILRRLEDDEKVDWER